MLTRSEQQVPTRRGHVGVYLGRCDLAEVLDARERFGAVTVQGRHGLDQVRLLRRMGRDIDGIDVDPATYRTRPAPPQADHLDLDGMDTSGSHWIEDQRRLGLGTIRTAAQRVRVGRTDDLRRALESDVPADVTITLALDGGWLGKRHIADLEKHLESAHRDVALVLGALFDPVDTADKLGSLRRLTSWAATEHLRLELLRTDLLALPAVLDGASYAAVGLTTSTRHLGIGMKAGQRDYVRRQRRPLVFVPRLLHWQRASTLGALAPWDGADIADCDCVVCAAEGSLLRFDRWFGSADEAKAAAADHNREALRRVLGEVLAADDPGAELRTRRDTALRLVREVRQHQRVEIDLPAWVESWS